MVQRRRNGKGGKAMHFGRDASSHDNFGVKGGRSDLVGNGFNGGYGNRGGKGPGGRGRPAFGPEPPRWGGRGRRQAGPMGAPWAHR